MIFNDKEYVITTWNGEQLGTILTLDTETEVVPFTQTPRVVTIQAYSGKTNEVFYIPLDKLRLFLDIHKTATFIFHNFAFDNDVLCKFLETPHYFHDKIEANKIHDTNLLYKLLHLGKIGFVPFKSNLGLLSEKYLGVKLDKDGEDRMGFGPYLGKTIESMPQSLLEYGAGDVIATHQIYFILMNMITNIDKYQTLLSHTIQLKGSVALNHIYKNGIGFDLIARDKWVKDLDVKMDVQRDILASYGWVRGVKGLKARYESIMDLMGLSSSLPRTKDGDLSSKSDDLAIYKDNPFVGAYLEFQTLEKASSFVRDITNAVIHPRYNTILNTGRTSCSKPNFQQLPRLGGIREMFIPQSSDNTFIITDYSTLELATLAQVMYNDYGESVMKDQINDGVDLHKFYASVMNGCDVDQVTKKQRQEAKAANFGFPGGLGTTTFRQFAAGYGLTISEAEAQNMKRAWHDAFPETKEYLSGEQSYVYTLTGRRRGNTTFCAEKNTPFQGLAADGAKLALYNLDRAGFKIVGFVHDEIICEVNKEEANKRLQEQEKIMIDSMVSVVPDVKITVESCISDTYTK